MNWLQTCENVAEVCKIKLFDVFELNIIAFLNMIGYVIWKNKEVEKKYNNK